MIGGQQARPRRDDTVPVVVGIAGESNLKAVLDVDQALHCVRRGRIHANLSIPVERHESEPGIHRLAHHGEIQFVVFCDRRPVMNAGPAQGIDTHADFCITNRFHIDHGPEISHVSGKIVVAVRRRGLQRFGV